MRLNKFLVENHNIEEITQGEFMATRDKRCDKAWKSKTVIYRGESSRKPWLYVIPEKGRTSAYAVHNTYNVLLSNLPSWKKYPKRGDSIVGSTSLIKARQYNGGLYTVYPFDGANIGVCPKSDIWDSFWGTLGRGESLDNFNFKMVDLFEYINIETEDMYNLSYTELVQNMGYVDDYFCTPEKFTRLYQKNRELYRFLECFHYTLAAGIPLFDCINKEMSPEKNNFSLVKAGKRILGDCEVWTDSPCLLELIK